MDTRIDRVRESLTQLAPDAVGKLDKKVSRTLTQALGAYQELGQQVAEQLGMLSDRMDDLEERPPPRLAQHPEVPPFLEELRLRLDALEEDVGEQAIAPGDYDVEGRMERPEAKMSEFQEQMTGTQAFQNTLTGRSPIRMRWRPTWTRTGGKRPLTSPTFRTPPWFGIWLPRGL